MATETELGTVATDAAGRVTSLEYQGRTRTMTWDVAGRLREVTVPGGMGGSTTVTYAYDAQGRRVGSKSGTSRARWVWGASELLEERGPANSGSGPAQVYERVGAVAVAAGGERLLHDALGSTVGRWDGTEATLHRYDAWGGYVAGASGAGSPSTAPGPGDPSIGYTGHQWDGTSSLVYAKARWYAPELGSFLSRDPVLGVPGNPVTWNAFGYANANPLKYVDPDGRLSVIDGGPMQYDSGDIVDAAKLVGGGAWWTVRSTFKAAGFTVRTAAKLWGTDPDQEAARQGLAHARKECARGDEAGCKFVKTWGAFVDPHSLVIEELGKENRFYEDFYGRYLDSWGPARTALVTSAAQAPFTVLQGLVGMAADPGEAAATLVELPVDTAEACWNAGADGFISESGASCAGGIGGMALVSTPFLKSARTTSATSAVSAESAAVSDSTFAARGESRLLTAGSRLPNAAGKIISFVTKQDRVFYRVFSCDSRVGAFLTSVRPKSAALAREALDLPPGNTAQFVQEVLVPAGTRLQRSRVRPGTFGGRGGAEQFELLEFIPTSNFGPGVPLQ